MVTLDFLEQVETFSSLDDAQLAQIQNLCQVVDFSRGDKIFGAGEEARFFWAVMQGRVDLHWEMPGRSALPESVITSLEKNKTFGWPSLIPPHQYGLFAWCASRQCRLLKIEGRALMELFEKDAAIGCQVMLKLLAVVGGRFLNLQDEIARRRGSDIINRW